MRESSHQAEALHRLMRDHDASDCELLETDDLALLIRLTGEAGELLVSGRLSACGRVRLDARA